MESCGIVYAATGGRRNWGEAVFSARSAQKVKKDIQTTLFVDEKGLDFINKDNPFSKVEILNNPNSRGKLDAIIGTPYDRTLYLDNDTEFKKAVLDDMFRLLDNFDVALAHAPLARIVTPIKEIPSSFPEFNGGVILFKKTDKVMEVFKRWRADYHAKNIPTKRGHKDQPYLRRALWESDLRIATLLPEYNVRRGANRRTCIHHKHGLNRGK
jgi:hypothetical protein